MNDNPVMHKVINLFEVRAVEIKSSLFRLNLTNSYKAN